MLPKRKVVYLSRFFEENVEQVANMCVKCYQQEDEVKVTGINRNFSNSIKAKRLQSLQKKQKLNENDNFTENTNSEEISSNIIKQESDENFVDNSSINTDSEEPSLDLHDITSTVDTEYDSSSISTSTSNISLQENRSNLDEDTNTDSQITSIENSSANNSCNFIDDEEKFDQIYTNLFINNKDKIVDCDNTAKIFEDISIDTNNEVSFKNILRKSNDVFEYSVQSFDDDVEQIENTIPNSSEIILNNSLNKIKCRQQYQDSSSDCSEENYDFFDNGEAKTDNISTEKITGTVVSQSIFKTLNSKNSRLYDDYSTNINSSKNYKLQSVSSLKYNTVQVASSAASLNNEDVTSPNNDKQYVSSNKHEEMIETTEDDNIIELINRIHSPVEFLTENNKTNIVKEKRLIEETRDNSVPEFNNRIDNPIISEDNQSLEETNRIEENIIEEDSTKETCSSQYFSQKPKSVSDAVQNYFECSTKETESKVISHFVPLIASNFPPKEEKTKRKINFSNLRKKI